MFLHADHEDGLRKPDAALLRRLISLAPTALREGQAVSWSVTDQVASEDVTGWTLAVAQPRVSAEKSLAKASKEVAAAIDRELQCYFVQRDSRLFGIEKYVDRRPCVRRIFARCLKRFAALELQDVEKVSAWCLYLRRILGARVFSESNWVRHSEFEPRLQACLARLELWRDRLQGGSQQTTLLEHMEERERAQEIVETQHNKAIVASKNSASGPLMSSMFYGFHRRVASARLPQLLAPATHEAWKRASLFAVHLSILGQLADPISAYVAGNSDASGLCEDLLRSLSGTAIIILLSAGPSPLALLLGSGWGSVASILPALAGPGFLPAVAADAVSMSAQGAMTWLASEGVRVISTAVRRDQNLRTAQKAYKALGMSPAGSPRYTPNDVHAQLAWRLQQGGNPMDLWLAYEKILHYHMTHPLHNGAWPTADLTDFS
mmetsp:Transcript_2470/g.5355  ORF Transcript_2470/g.5355 Transcript_2470/m.5355 type:complete len:435 (+) Transcript_2470:72-1376(+)